MTHEIEPAQPNGERAKDNSDMLTQEWVVEGLVVDTDGEKPKYVVTKVVSGEANVYPGDYRFHELTSPNTSFILSPEKLMDYGYRGITSDGYYRHADKDDHDLDYLLGGDVTVAVGDRIRIVRWSQKIPIEYDVFGGGTAKSWNVEKFDDITLLESGVDIRKEEARVLKQKKFIRKNLAGILRRLEQMQLQQRERLYTDVDTVVTWEYLEKEGRYIARFTYGELPIEDHFVTLTAERYTPDDENPLPGDLRFTQSGRAFLQRDITAGTPSKELALIEEPMLELSASVWTHTAFNPEVDNIRVDLVIDDARYSGSIDIEQSTRSFRHPGHHLEFTTFSAPDVKYDGVEIKAEEADAILTYKDTIRRLRFQASRAGIQARRGQQEISQDTSTDLVSVESVLQDIQLAGQKAFQDLQPIIQQINARPSDSIFGGVRLLMPLSKLESVRVVVSQSMEV